MIGALRCRRMCRHAGTGPLAPRRTRARVGLESCLPRAAGREGNLIVQRDAESLKLAGTLNLYRLMCALPGVVKPTQRIDRPRYDPAKEF